MESLCGKRAIAINGVDLRMRLAGATSVLIDLGTGDGRFVRAVARACPECFVIGVDACREPLREVSRSAPTNALFLIANVLSLPNELAGLADQVTMICAWGSMLEGLLYAAPEMVHGLKIIGRAGARATFVVNERALGHYGLSLANGAEHIAAVLEANGLRVEARSLLNAAELRAWPTSWSRRMASGNQPRAVQITAVLTPFPAASDAPASRLVVPQGRLDSPQSDALYYQ